MSDAVMELDIYLDYEDGVTSKPTNFKCSSSCVKGFYSGPIDVDNKRTTNATLHIIGYMSKNDELVLNSISYGDLLLRSIIYPDSRDIVTKSCKGQVTATVFFGKAGVGKSTIASLTSSKPGLFEVGTSGIGTTTLGTWLSSSVDDGEYAKFADLKFQPHEELQDLPSL